MPKELRPGSTARPKQEFRSIQVLRAVAALSVIAYHGIWSLSSFDSRINPDARALQGPASGVDIFFVISGFVMVISIDSVLRQPRSALSFLSRRLQRIVPLYWLATTLTIIIHATAPAYSTFESVTTGHVISSFLFIPAYRTPILPPGWTLNYEMLFYLLFTLSISLKFRPVRFVSGLLVALSLLHRYVGTAPILGNWTDSILLEFAFGMILADLAAKGKFLSEKLSWILIVVGFVLLATGEHGHYLPRFVFWGIPALSIVAGAVSLEAQLADRIPHWLTTLGDASYSLYLVHMMIAWSLSRAMQHSHLRGLVADTAFFAVYMAITLLAGLIVYWAIEKPMIDFFRERRRRSRIAAVCVGT